MKRFWIQFQAFIHSSKILRRGSFCCAIVANLTILALLAGFVPSEPPSEIRLAFHSAKSFSEKARPFLSENSRPDDNSPWHVIGSLSVEVQTSETLTGADSYLSEIEKKTLQRMQRPLASVQAITPKHSCVAMSSKQSPDPFFNSLTSERFCASLDKKSNKNELGQQNNHKLYANRAKNFASYVNKYAKQYKINPALINAIIQAESSFNPRLVSNRFAHGLMQVVPDSAGKEVHAWLGLEGMPSPYILFDPATNIKYGTSYLHLLLTRHLGEVRSPLVRQYIAIAAYNMGINAVLRTFDAQKDLAIAKINRMSPQQIYVYLQARLPAKETRLYLKKVLRNMASFQKDLYMAQK